MSKANAFPLVPLLWPPPWGLFILLFPSLFQSWVTLIHSWCLHHLYAWLNIFFYPFLVSLSFVCLAKHSFILKFKNKTYLSDLQMTLFFFLSLSEDSGKQWLSIWIFWPEKWCLTQSQGSIPGTTVGLLSTNKSDSWVLLGVVKPLLLKKRIWTFVLKLLGLRSLELHVFKSVAQNNHPCVTQFLLPLHHFNMF